MTEKVKEIYDSPVKDNVDYYWLDDKIYASAKDVDDFVAILSLNKYESVKVQVSDHIWDILNEQLEDQTMSLKRDHGHLLVFIDVVGNPKELE